MLSGFEFYYSPVVYQEEIQADLLALDCFHPNRQGQPLFSDKLWEDQPWFK